MKTLRIVLIALVALAAGLIASTHAQTLLFTLDTPNPQPHADFGNALAAGDVNGDGKADVVVGAPYEDVGGNTSQGRVYVLLGPGGLLDRQLDTPNPQPDAEFGYSLAVGDVDGDGKADVAVGAPHEDVGGNENQGRAYVFSGADGSLLFTLDIPNPQPYAEFGYSLAVGDVDGDGKADIAVGAHYEDVGGNFDQGRVHLFWGPDGWPAFTLDTPNPRVWGQFGYSLAVGDVDGDGFADIAVGAPHEDVGGTPQGRVHLFWGPDGWPAFTLDTPNPQPGAWFGHSLAVGDVNGDGTGDIAVGAPSEDVGGNAGQGRAYVFSGADASLLFTLDIPNAQPYARFGHSLAAGDVSGDCGADVAVGAPWEDVGGNADQGRAYVFLMGCEAGVDTDLDGFDDDVECYLGTDPLDNCPDYPGHDAWPLDTYPDGELDIRDMLAFYGNVGFLFRDPGWSPAVQRFDLNADGATSVVADLLRFYRGMWLESCDGGTPEPPSWPSGAFVTMGIDPEITGNGIIGLGPVEACWRVDVPQQELGDGMADHTIDVYVTGATPPPGSTGYDAWLIYDPDRVDPVSWNDLFKLIGASSYTTKVEEVSRLNAAAAYPDSGAGFPGEGTIVRIYLDAISAGPACFVFGHAMAYASSALHPTVARVAMLAINEDCPTQDSDGDGVFDICDRCPDDYNPSQRDFDGDGRADACDNCPSDYNPGQEDADGDDWGDTCDNCPTTPTPWYVPLLDDDCDGFTTAVEEYAGTDPDDPCPDTLDDDAWPPDVDNNTEVDILDVLHYKWKLGPNTYDPRYDLNADGEVDILDVLLYKPFLRAFASCTNP